MNEIEDRHNTWIRHLTNIVDQAAHLLPSQGPIGVFIHHNTLHAFQHLPFEEAVVEASKKFGAEPFLTEARYRSEVKREESASRTSRQSSTLKPTPQSGHAR